MHSGICYGQIVHACNDQRRIQNITAVHATVHLTVYVCVCVGVTVHLAVMHERFMLNDWLINVRRVRVQIFLWDTMIQRIYARVLACVCSMCVCVCVEYGRHSAKQCTMVMKIHVLRTHTHTHKSSNGIWSCSLISGVDIVRIAVLLAWHGMAAASRTGDAFGLNVAWNAFFFCVARMREQCTREHRELERIRLDSAVPRQIVRLVLA